MRLSSTLSHGVVIGIIAAIPVASFAQNPPLRVISKMELEYPEPFSCISGIRELSDGRIIVSDVREKTVQLIDLKKGTATKIGREGQGPGEWSTPQGVFAVPGDTSLLWDPQNRRFLTIRPDGSLGKEVTVDLGGGARGQIMSTLPRAADTQGRLYYQGSGFVFTEGQPPTQLDSAPILRYDRRTAKLDTVSFIQLPKSDIQTSSSAGNVSIRMTGQNAVASQRAWAVAPDGRIAFISPEPYHVEWLSGARARTVGPEVRYDRLKLTEADKAPVQTPNCGVTISFGDGGGGGRGGTIQATTRAAVGGGGPGGGAPPRTDYPEYKPAFLPRYGAPIVAPNGELWVGRSRGPNDPPIYDVFDARGQLTGRVQLPKGTRISGFGNGTLYLFRMDEDDLVYLQRYRLDAAR
jgi:hypothetical protein